MPRQAYQGGGDPPLPTSGPNYAGSAALVGPVNQGSWATIANATGTNNDSYAVWSKPAAAGAVSQQLELSSFGTFTGVGSNDIINSVTVNVNEFVANTTRMQAWQYQLWDGATAQVGATQTGTNTATTTNVDSFAFTGVTFAQLSTLRVRLQARGSASNTQASSGSADYVSLTVDYTAAQNATVNLTVVAGVTSIPLPTIVLPYSPIAFVAPMGWFVP